MAAVRPPLKKEVQRVAGFNGPADLSPKQLDCKFDMDRDRDRSHLRNHTSGFQSESKTNQRRVHPRTTTLRGSHFRTKSSQKEDHSQDGHADHERRGHEFRMIEAWRVEDLRSSPLREPRQGEGR